MNKLVASVFKAILFSMIFIVVWDVAFYLLRTYSLNYKVETLMSTVCYAVSKENYLSEDAYKMVDNTLANIMDVSNGGVTDVSKQFVTGYEINYLQPALGVGTSVTDGEYLVLDPNLTYSVQLNTPANFGDIAVIQIIIHINSTNWFFDRSEQASADQLKRQNLSNSLVFTSQQPCLRYIKQGD